MPPHAAAIQHFDVAIAGGSYAGLALALAIDKEFAGDVRALVIDRSTAPVGVADSRASAISAGSQRLLAALGVWHELAPVAQPVSRIDITDSPLDAGMRPVLLSYDNHVGNTPATYIVPNGALAAALARRAAGLPAITLLRTAVSGFARDDAGVTVTLDSGQTIGASLLVAADGRRSRLREAAGIKSVGWAYPQTGIVTTVAHERPHGGVATQHFLPSGPFAMLPLTGNRTCVTWTEDKDEAERILALDDDGFLAALDLRFGGRLGQITVAGPRQSWPLEMHLAHSYVAQRFALLGDAAHSVHPIAGQGLNLALRDVAALAEVLADAGSIGLDLGNAETLARYERWRRFDSGLSAATFDGLNRLFSRDGMLTRTVRSAGLGMVERIPEIKSLLVGEAAGLTGELPRLMRA